MGRDGGNNTLNNGDVILIGLGGEDTLRVGNGNDILDLSQLLSGVGTDPNVLQDYLDFAFSGITTTISIRTVASGPLEQQVMLDNVNLSRFMATAMRRQ